MNIIEIFTFMIGIVGIFVSVVLLVYGLRFGIIELKARIRRIREKSIENQATEK